MRVPALMARPTVSVIVVLQTKVEAFGPAGPCGPVAPWGPALPAGPTAPASPFGPTAP